ncbi:MAG: hypothetical protein M3406_07175 [Chloroflexota bacterium]|nr:hypothetical protein [Chloroflexota bacterium]
MFETAFDPASIPVQYSCGSHHFPFAAAELAAAPDVAELDTPEADALRADEDFRDATDWRLAARQPGRVLFLARFPGGRSLGYVIVAWQEDRWQWAGSGDCRAEALLDEWPPGTWRLDPDRPLERDDRRLHLLMTGPHCFDRRRVIGAPIIASLPDDVLITIPVRNDEVGVGCAPRDPDRYTVDLPEPLGLRRLWDIGTYPPRPPHRPEWWR